MRLEGIDVSHWQSEINWQECKQTNIAFAIVKATDGISYVDPQFKNNWVGIQKIGLQRGAYHYYRPEADAEQQATHFVQTVGNFDQLPPILDLEQATQLNNATLIHNIKVWLDKVEALTNQRCIIYTSGGYWNARMVDSHGQPPTWTTDYHLWLAQWTHAAQPTLPLGWQTWLLWQYTNAGHVNGINGPVDCSWFNGSLDELSTLDSLAPNREPLPYIVQQGDTLPDIARQHHTTVSHLIEANPHLLQPGVALKIPFPDAPAPPPVYVVQSGDTLGVIAQRFGTTVQALATLNHIQNVNNIMVGQRLIIP